MSAEIMIVYTYVEDETDHTIEDHYIAEVHIGNNSERHEKFSAKSESELATKIIEKLEGPFWVDICDDNLQRKALNWTELCHFIEESVGNQLRNECD